MRSLSTGTVEDPYSAHFHKSRRHPAAGALLVERLRMSQSLSSFSHRPVMVDEVIALFEPVPSGLLVDGTVGGGGHARALLTARPDLTLLGIDRDNDALVAARETLAPFGTRVRLVHDRFDRLSVHIGDGTVVGVLLDLGVSSPQFDRPERGFSYRNDAPLDMRMDRSQMLTAADIVNGYDEGELARMFTASGERRLARRLAARIVAARPLTTTTQLADVVRDAKPAATRRTGGHPARRVFQALRIEVNGELQMLPQTIDTQHDRRTSRKRRCKRIQIRFRTGGLQDLPGLVSRGVIGPDERILFWHTGGGPALFAHPEVVADTRAG